MSPAQPSSSPSAGKAPLAWRSTCSSVSPSRAPSVAAAAPQLAERAGGTHVDGTTDFLLELQRVAAQTLAFDAARRDVLEHRVDEAAERAHELGHAFALLGEHDRKVVAQGREVAVRRQHRRTQAEAVDRRQAVARHRPVR